MADKTMNIRLTEIAYRILLKRATRSGLSLNKTIERMLRESDPATEALLLDGEHERESSGELAAA